ncbi:MAG: DUF2892 domain-containing protein [Gammaproteobacteria bacterium]|nr:DUF2892 domain-containing protein [Gammaproteobacteria bacterium]
MVTSTHQAMDFGPNVGKIDRYARFGLAALIIGAVMAMSDYDVLSSAYIVILLATIPLVMSAIVRWDPLYAMLHIHTLASDLWAKTEIKTKDFAPNLSVPRRVMRVLTATAMIVLPIAYGSEPMTWEPFVILAAIPVAITAIMGWGPIEAMVKDEPEEV